MKRSPITMLLFFIACVLSFQTQAAISLKHSEHIECASCKTDAQFYEEAKKQSNIIDRYISIMNIDTIQIKNLGHQINQI